MKLILLSTLWKSSAIFLLGMLSCVLLQKMMGISEKHIIEDLVRVTKTRTLMNVLATDQESKPDYNEIGQWANFLPSLVTEDNRRIANLMRKMTLQTPSNEIRNIFYEVMNFPLQAVCTVGKFLGGQWVAGYGCIDGNKFVCLDNFHRDVKNGKCLIYTFGVSDDWTFEEMAASMGCRIYAHDPTIDGSRKPNNGLISFKRIGIKELSSNSSSVGPVLTLKDAIELNGDFGKQITYLKVDVEGSELKSISQWIDSGVLDYVRQIGIEIHTAQDFVPQPQVAPVLLELMDNTQKLHNMGFRLISSTNNGCSSKESDLEHRYNPFFELVFYKP